MAVKKAQRSTRAPLQKSVHQKLRNKEQQKQVTSVNDKDKKAVVIAQEIKFARLLSNNDKITRDRVLKNLRKWLTVRSQSSFESDFTRLWKGLFYCMWMSDKPLIQEELAESLSKIVHCFKAKDVVLLYTTCALRTLGIEWYGIDQYRLDKFCMLVRRIIRQTFQKCKENLWDIKWIKGVSEILEKLLLDPKVCLGFNMHVIEVFLEELSKISGGNISEDVTTELIKPFVLYLTSIDDEKHIKFVMRHIFRYLIFQSDVGIDYIEKFHAWRNAGFPTGSIDAMEKIELSDGEIDDNDTEEFEKENFEKFLQSQAKNDIENPLDPRAGKVNVELPQIPFDAKQIVTLLEQYKFHPSSTTTSRRQIRHLIKEFTEVSQGKMPLGIKEIVIPKKQKKDTSTKSAAIRLLKFEKELYSDNSKKGRKRKNMQLTQDESDNSNDEELEDVNDDRNSGYGVTEIGDSEIVKNKKRIKRKLSDTNNLINAHSQVLAESDFSLKRKKFKTKENEQDNSEINEKNSNCKLQKDSSVLIEDIDVCKKMKLKRTKNVVAKMLNVVRQNKKKKNKETKLKVTGKWDVSDNINPPIPVLNNVGSNNEESCAKTTEKSNTDDHEQKNNILNDQPTWLLPALTKLKNEKNRTMNLKGQHKMSNITNSKKRVKIALQRNTAQHTSEYMLQIRKSPAIPFDANKKPLVGVLKASPIPSPINPFYKRNII
ncbi:unnamed protein product [Xylocopa violacea]|uniref:Ribosomal RNA processing protein 1 homolog n=1 Tax=Xylocopa violacea TaxID=135666 RepID=A0ABP1NTD9_XYLVO